MAICLQNVSPIFYSLLDKEKQKMLAGAAVVCLLTLSLGLTRTA